MQDHYTPYNSTYTAMDLPTLNNDIDRRHLDYDGMFEKHQQEGLFKKREQNADSITISMTHASDTDTSQSQQKKHKIRIGEHDLGSLNNEQSQ